MKNVFEYCEYTANGFMQPDFDWEPIGKPEPTSLPVGSPEKIELFRARLERGEELFHERDKLGAGQETRRQNRNAEVDK